MDIAWCGRLRGLPSSKYPPERISLRRSLSISFGVFATGVVLSGAFAVAAVSSEAFAAEVVSPGISAAEAMSPGGFAGVSVSISSWAMGICSGETPSPVSTPAAIHIRTHVIIAILRRVKSLSYGK